MESYRPFFEAPLSPIIRPTNEAGVVRARRLLATMRRAQKRLTRLVAVTTPLLKSARDWTRPQSEIKAAKTCETVVAVNELLALSAKEIAKAARDLCYKNKNEMLELSNAISKMMDRIYPSDPGSSVDFSSAKYISTLICRLRLSLDGIDQCITFIKSGYVETDSGSEWSSSSALELKAMDLLDSER